MANKVLIITHENIGTALLKATETTYGQLPILTTLIAVGSNVDPDELSPQLEAYTKTLNDTDGLLVLTDKYGSTPCNIALRLKDKANVKIVAGLNLPMMIRIMNYPDLDIDALCEKAITGGREGVVSCPHI